MRKATGVPDEKQVQLDSFFGSDSCCVCDLNVLTFTSSLVGFEMVIDHDGVHPPVLKHGPRSLTSVRVIC